METFSVIKHKGRVMKATTLQGYPVERQDYLYVEEWGGFVTCAPYEEHFLYENPDQSIGSSSYMCTCGSAAVVANPEKGEAALFVCLFHATYGSHATSHVNVKDFEQIAGQTLDVQKPERAKWH